MKLLKKTLSLLLLLSLASVHARPMGVKTTPQAVAQPQLVNAQPVCKGGVCKFRAAAPQPKCKGGMCPLAQAAPRKQIVRPQSYAQALNIIRTQMSSNDVFVGNLFNKEFIDMVLSLDIADEQTQALLEAGVNLHAPLTNNDQTTWQTLSFLTDNIEGFMHNRPQPIIQPIAPAQPAAPKLVQPALVKPALIVPKQAAQVQQAANVNNPDPLYIGNTKITFVLGDITHQNVDAIVNAANENLRHGGGIAAAISKASGISKDGISLLQHYCNAMPAINAKGEKCPLGGAVITPAFELEKVGIKKIIHAVGPLGSDPNRETLLTRAYQNSLKVAQDNGLHSIALPAISTAIFGYNINQATPVAFAAVRDFVKKNPNAFDEIRFILFSGKDMTVYKKFKNELLK